MKTKLLIVASWILAAACTSAAPTGNPAPVGTPTTSPDATSTPPPPTSATAAPTTSSATPAPGPAQTSNSAIVGTWESASCGKRKYARTIQFDAAGTFVGQDLVSPCPKGTACVWSGIVGTNGTFTVQADKVTLTLTEPVARPEMVEPFPATMTVDRATSAPIETLKDGTRCVYTRAAETATPKK